jgi:hypothetical protein
MEFLDISSLGVTYRYAVKIENKIKHKTQQFGFVNPSQQKQGKASQTHRIEDRERMDSLRKTSP